MKPVNLIQPLSPQKKREIRRWYLFSILGIVVTLSVIIIFSIPQYLLFLHTKKELLLLREKSKEYDNLIKQKQELEQKKIVISNKKDTIAHYTSGTKNPHLHIQFLIDACKNGYLETIHFTKKNCEIIARYSCVRDIHSLAHSLSNSSLFSSMKLTTLTHDIQKKEFRCTLKGKLIYT